MRAGEAEDPQQISDEFAMGVVSMGGSGLNVWIGQGMRRKITGHEENLPRIGAGANEKIGLIL